MKSTIDTKTKSHLWRLGHLLFAMLFGESLAIFCTVMQFPILASCLEKAANAATIPVSFSFRQLTGIVAIIYILSIPLRIHVTNCARPLYISLQNLEGKQDEIKFKYGLICNIIGKNLIALVFCGILWLLIPYLVKFALWVSINLHWAGN